MYLCWAAWGRGHAGWPGRRARGWSGEEGILGDLWGDFQHALFMSSDCPEMVDPFQGSQGLILSGHVIPALPGVTISIQLNDADTLVASTDHAGAWRVGPVHGDKVLSVQVVSAIEWVWPCEGWRVK